jgi:hypothetical protein
MQWPAQLLQACSTKTALSSNTELTLFSRLIATLPP